jgi:colicin import membrane protein
MNALKTAMLSAILLMSAVSAAGLPCAAAEAAAPASSTRERIHRAIECASATGTKAKTDRLEIEKLRDQLAVAEIGAETSERQLAVAIKLEADRARDVEEAVAQLIAVRERLEINRAGEPKEEGIKSVKLEAIRSNVVGLRERQAEEAAARLEATRNKRIEAYRARQLAEADVRLATVRLAAAEAKDAEAAKAKAKAKAIAAARGETIEKVRANAREAAARLAAAEAKQGEAAETKVREAAEPKDADRLATVEEKQTETTRLAVARTKQTAVAASSFSSSKSKKCRNCSSRKGIRRRREKRNNTIRTVSSEVKKLLSVSESAAIADSTRENLSLERKKPS